MKNKYFNPTSKQERVEAKLKRYVKAIKDFKLKAMITNMPQTQDTLDILEKEFNRFTDSVDGGTDKEKWQTVSRGSKLVKGILKSQPKKDVD